MKKYTWSIILIVVGFILLFYGYPSGYLDNSGPNDSSFNYKKASMNVGGILVAIGGIMAIVKSQQK